MNLKLSVVGLLALAVSGVTALAETSQYADEIDITKTVREAGGCEKPNLDEGENAVAGYTVDNAFGDVISNESRVLLKGVKNTISWRIKDDFQVGQPVVVTSYMIRRAYYTGGVGSGGDWYSSHRAPKSFSLQASRDGKNWIVIDRQSVDWGDSGPMEMSFAVEPVAWGDYRRYRLVVDETNALSEDAAKCSFQYVKLFGTIGDYAPLAHNIRTVDSLLTTSRSASRIDHYVPTLDSKLSIDFALTETKGTQAILIAGRRGNSDQMRLFYTETDGWLYHYGSQEKKSGVKAYPSVRYKVVIDGPKVTVNGVLVIDAGERLTGPAGTMLGIFGSFTSAGYEFFNKATARFWGVEAWAADGTPTLELHPARSSDGCGHLYDALTQRVYDSNVMDENDSLVADYKDHGSFIDLSACLRYHGKEPIVTLKEGKNKEGFSPSNAFTGGLTTDDRALFETAHNVLQYDIPDDFSAGQPIVISQFAIIPCVNAATDPTYTVNRAPIQFELQASKDGEKWVSLSKRTVGVGPGSYSQHGSRKVGDVYGYYGCSFDVPEECRDDYRHYRFITEKSSSADYDSIKMGVQEIKLFGYVWGFDVPCEPIEYVENAYDMQQANTYYNTGVVPEACDLKIELTGAFTKTDATSCLFCSRDSVGNNSWTLFLVDGALRLYCGSSDAVSSTFRPEVNRVYNIKVVGNELFVDGECVYTSGGTDFTPGGEIVLMASHKGGGTFDNQARFQLRSCRISDAKGGCLRDYVAVNRTDGNRGLLDLANGAFCPSSSSWPKVGNPVDMDFHQRDREVKLLTGLENGRLPKGQLLFALTGDQRLSAELYAAMDDTFKGNLTNAWAAVVKVGDVVSGTDVVDVTLPKTDFKRVKFFVCDKVDRVVSYTKTYRIGYRGLTVIIR